MVIDDCSRFAIHDLAALADGNLSRAGVERLTGHLRRCATCAALLATIVDETTPARGTGDLTEAANLARTLCAETAR